MKLIDSLVYQPVELAFGTSGLRGLASDMTDLECYINVAGFLHFLESNDGLKKGEKIYIAGDLRDSTPRIMQSVATAVADSGYEPFNCGHIPTPALAYYALRGRAACIMVTGSHIPADRNGVKFYKRGGEVMKEDEAAIKQAVAAARQLIYSQDSKTSAFDFRGNLKRAAKLPEVDTAAATLYIQRYTNVFASDSLRGKKIVAYQHSAVGRDMLVTILQRLGAEVVPIERSNVFVPIDTENVTEEDKIRFRKFAREFPDALAIISADGDSDRPFVIDETGTFHRGDVLGCVVAKFLGAKLAAVPISANDAVTTFCQSNGIELVSTKIGSPYVIQAMRSDASLSPAVSWEVNGGFLTGDDIMLEGGLLKALPTRDAVLPILCSLLTAVQQNRSLSSVFADLPQRFTGGGLIDNVSEVKIQKFREASSDKSLMGALADRVFGMTDLGPVDAIDLTDGLRLLFKSGDVIHLRPSGNAPQFRVYTNADTQERTDKLAADSLSSMGYIQRLLGQLNV